MTLVRYVLLGIIGISVLVVLGVLVSRSAIFQAPLCSGCNIVVVSLDAFPARAVFDETSPLFSFPSLRTLSKERGISFTEAYTSTKQGWLANVSLLTGEYPWNIGLWRPENGIPDDVPLLSEMLLTYGYETAAFTRGTFVDAPWGFNRGFETFVHLQREDMGETFVRAREWLDEREDTQPFFLFLQPTDLYDWFSDSASSLAYDNLVRAHAGDTFARDAIENGYVTNMKEVDKLLIAFLEDIDSTSTRPTVVVVVGTYGEEFLERPKRGIGEGPLPYKQWLHVPLIVFIPEHASHEVQATVETKALADTLKRIVGATNVFDTSSDLIPYFSGKTTDQVARAYVVATNEPTFTIDPSGYEAMLARVEESATQIEKTRAQEPHGPTVRSVLSGKWHLMVDESDSYWLFDIHDDPFEEKNRIESQHILSAQSRATIGTLMSELLRF